MPQPYQSVSTLIHLPGEAGQLAIIEDRPEQIRAVAVVTHPHPLMGGSPLHKIPQLITDVLVEQGCLVWRPFFRGVGDSAGQHDQGEGESRDIAGIVQALRQTHSQLPLVGGGFSFGAHVWVRAWQQLTASEQPRQLLLAGLPCGEVRGAVTYDTPPISTDLCLLHGEKDDICALQDVIRWATPQRHPIIIMPGANHFFTGYLNQLRREINHYFSVN